MDFVFLLNYILRYPNVEMDLDDIISKKENLKKFTPLIFNRYLSFHSDIKVKNAAFLINKYLFTIKDNGILFSLMCNLTPSIQKTYIQYKSKNKKTDKYSDVIIKNFKKYYGEFYNKQEISEIVDFVYNTDKKEFVKICLSMGMTVDEVTKQYPDIKEFISDIKIDISEKKKYVKYLKDNKKTIKNKKTYNKHNESDIDSLI